MRGGALLCIYFYYVIFLDLLLIVNECYASLTKNNELFVSESTKSIILICVLYNIKLSVVIRLRVGFANRRLIAGMEWGMEVLEKVTG